MNLARLESEQSCSARWQLEQQRQQCAVRGSQQQRAEQRQQQYRLPLCEGDSRGRTGDCSNYDRAECAGSWTPAASRTKAHQTRPVSQSTNEGNEYANGAGAGSVCESERERPRAKVIQPSTVTISSVLGWLLAVALLTPRLLLAVQGSDISGLFTVDTRWGFSGGAAVSGLFSIDTRLSGSANAGASGVFTVNTLGAGVGNAIIAGYVTNTNGAALSGATVSALQNNVMRGQVGTDGSGYYQLNSLVAGTYLVRAEKAGYLTGLRYGVGLSSGETEIQHFTLAGSPASPLSTNVSRNAEALNLVSVSSTQLLVFTNGGFVTNGAIDPAKMTVVITHGWLSQPDYWAEGMASNMVAGGVANANIVAWDWRTAAGYPDPGLSFSAIPRQGEKLGQVLSQSLGTSYGLPIHFIGHSFGTLVNGEAANYLHEQTGGAFPSSSTHVTLLDDAALGNVAGRLVTMRYTIPGLANPLTHDISSTILAQVMSVGFVFPVPHERAWMDNYISLVGIRHDEAVNVYLVEGVDHISPWYSPIQLHSYAWQWYSKTAYLPSGASLLGHRYSYERMNAALFPQTVPHSSGDVFRQIEGGGELDLAELYGENEIEAASWDVRAAIIQLGLQKSVDAAAGVAQKTGNAVVDVAESFIPHTPTGTPVFTGTAGSTPAYYTENGIEQIPAWSLRVNLRSPPPPSSLVVSSLVSSGAGPQPSGGSQLNGEPPCVWIPVAVPTNAVVFCFDFSFNGQPGGDILSASIAGTNVFALEAKFMPTNTPLNSGTIDVSRWSGQTVEFFFGLLGGSSTNADLTVSGLRFYEPAAPALNIQIAGNDVLISWPATVQGYQLETTTTLALGNSWNVLTNTPALVGLQNVVTNSVLSGERFYRLKR